MSHRSDIDPELARLMAASLANRDEDATSALSAQIAARLGTQVTGLELIWQTDPRSPRRRPSLYAMPVEGTREQECERFAKAALALGGGRYASHPGDGCVVFRAETELAGVKAAVDLVVWNYDHPAAYARLIPDLIDRFRT